jgi:hypothetical protein
LAGLDTPKISGNLSGANAGNTRQEDSIMKVAIQKKWKIILAFFFLISVQYSN